MNNQETILKQAGLSEEQAIIYETLLQNGPQKAGFLISWTGIKRGLVYKVLEQLENMGLIEKKDEKGTVSVFSPNHPSRILEKMDRDQKNIELSKEMVSSGLGNLISQYNLLGGKPNVRFFEGKDAILQIVGDFPKKDTIIKQIIDIASAYTFLKEETLTYLKKRADLRISKQMIIPNTQENIEYAKTHPSKFTEYRILPSNIPHPTSFQIYDNKITILTLKQEKTVGIILEDEDIKNTMENMFSVLWELSKKVE